MKDKDPWTTEYPGLHALAILALWCFVCWLADGAPGVAS